MASKKCFKRSRIIGTNSLRGFSNLKKCRRTYKNGRYWWIFSWRRFVKTRICYYCQFMQMELRRHYQKIALLLISILHFRVGMKLLHVRQRFQVGQDAIQKKLLGQWYALFPKPRQGLMMGKSLDVKLVFKIIYGPRPDMGRESRVAPRKAFTNRTDCRYLIIWASKPSTLSKVWKIKNEHRIHRSKK